MYIYWYVKDNACIFAENRQGSFLSPYVNSSYRENIQKYKDSCLCMETFRVLVLDKFLQFSVLMDIFQSIHYPHRT